MSYHASAVDAPGLNFTWLAAFGAAATVRARRPFFALCLQAGVLRLYCQPPPDWLLPGPSEAVYSSLCRLPLIEPFRQADELL